MMYAWNNRWHEAEAPGGQSWPVYFQPRIRSSVNPYFCFLDLAGAHIHVKVPNIMGVCHAYERGRIYL